MQEQIHDQRVIVLTLPVVLGDVQLMDADVLGGVRGAFLRYRTQGERYQAESDVRFVEPIL